MQAPIAGPVALAADVVEVPEQRQELLEILESLEFQGLIAFFQPPELPPGHPADPADLTVEITGFPAGANLVPNTIAFPLDRRRKAMAIFENH
jgi:hypothetical protein